MLSRHFLRAKALQSIYAGISAKISDPEEVVKLYDYNVTRLDDLGIIQLSALTHCMWVAERVVENNKQKFTQSASDIQMMQYIADNSFIAGLNDCYELKKEFDRMNIDWANQFDLFRRALHTLKDVQLYSDRFMSNDHSFETDKDTAVALFKILMNDDSLRDSIFERELLWEDDFDQIAQYVLMRFKEIREEDMNAGMPCPKVYDSRNEKERNDYNFARQLTIDTFGNIDNVEPLIRKHLQNWDFERVALMDVLLINMAVTEFTMCPSIPERVTVDEYIELSKEFSTDKSKLFINGILDKILIELRVAGRIVKDERGMYDPELEKETQTI